MSYWEQFAKMFGLELDEEFSLAKSNGEKINKDTYKVKVDGLFYKSPFGTNWYREPSKTTYYLLMGDYKVLLKPWKPKNGEMYWHYSEAWKEAISFDWEGGLNDLFLWKLGNCFKTQEEANIKGKEVIEQIRKDFEEA